MATRKPLSLICEIPNFANAYLGKVTKFESYSVFRFGVLSNLLDWMWKTTPPPPPGMNRVKITFKADELMDRKYEKTSLILEIMLRDFLRQFNTKQHTLLNKLLVLHVAKQTYQPLSIRLFDLTCFFFY